MKQELLGGISLCVVGLILFLVPAKTIWTVTEKWKTKNGEAPSKNYTIQIRVLGAVFSIVGIALMVFGA